MGGAGYLTRLAAIVAASALLGVLIMNPNAGERAIDRVAAIKPVRAPLASQPCPQGVAPLSGPFANIDDVVSVSPLGAVTAPGEPLPAPYIRVNTRKGETVFERRSTRALAPARSDVTAIERKIVRSANAAAQESWTIHFTACQSIDFYYDRLDSVDADLLRQAGGLEAFSELGGPDHLAVETRIRLKAGDVVGAGDGFDVGLHDAQAQPATLARPERYSTNPYARAAVFNAAPSLLAALAHDQTKARCPIDYLPARLRDLWSEKLGDAYGLRRATGEDACRTALVDRPGTAQGAWFTDASHNAATTKVSAIALAADAVDPDRQIFALHGRVKSLTPDFVALAPMLSEQREKAANDFLTFEKGSGDAGSPRINASFADVEEGPIYCYNRLRANFVGPQIMGVVLLQTSRSETGAALMKIEALNNVMSCIDLAEPWAFTGAETTFYR